MLVTLGDDLTGDPVCTGLTGRRVGGPDQIPGVDPLDRLLLTVAHEHARAGEEALAAAPHRCAQAPIHHARQAHLCGDGGLFAKFPAAHEVVLDHAIFESVDGDAGHDHLELDQAVDYDLQLWRLREDVTEDLVVLAPAAWVLLGLAAEEAASVQLGRRAAIAFAWLL
ncbi:hypothetical protein [Streptomyces griseoluteus]|uniref:hypothetical protein n=1 Tax=Streptomyces griseoluteus TaxID=29306 RepID=UPI001FCC1DF9|nr:hypothetical protein [Streptomyces griseoluteus]